MSSKYLPSKKFVLITLGIAVAAALLYGGYHYFTTGKILFIKQANPQAGLSVADVTSRDSDGDGIPDWEESLWGTDPNKKDTDGNGMPDNIEIEKRREALNVGTPQTPEDEKLNDTDRFAREFFTTIVSLKQSGNFNAQAVTNLSLALNKNIGEQKTLPDIYDTASLKIVPATQTSIHKYYTDLQIITLPYTKQGVGEELTILGTAVENEDQVKLDELIPIGTAYKDMAGALSNIAVPSDIAVNHLLLINSYQKISVGIAALTELLDNPLKGMIGFTEYNEASTNALSAIANFESYFKKNGIL